MIDLTPPQIQVFVGALEVTKFLDGLVVEHLLSEVSTPLFWGGTMVLVSSLSTLAESFDDMENPLRWAAGAHRVEVWLDGSPWQYLRIARNGYQYNEVRQAQDAAAIAQVTFTDLLGLLDTYSPIQDVPGITIGAGTRWEVAVANLLLAAAARAGISITLNLPLTDKTDQFTAPLVVDSGSLVKTAQRIAGERLRWFWCNKEVIEWAEYPLVGGTVVYQKSREKLDDYWRAKGLEKPVNFQTVTAACQTASTCPADEYPREFVRTGTKIGGGSYIIERRTEDREELGNQVTESVSTEMNILLAYPRPFTFSGDPYASVIIEDRRRITTTDPVTGKIIEIEEVADRAIGLYTEFRSSFPVPSWSLLLPTCEKRVIRYEQDPTTKRLKRIITDEYFPAFKLYRINNSAPLLQQVEATIRYRTIEEWVPDCGEDTFEKQTHLYEAQLSTTSAANPLVYVSTTREPNSQPPEQPGKPATTPLKQKVLKGTYHMDYSSGSSFVPAYDTKTADTLIDQAGCDRLAEYYARLRWQRYFGKEVSHGYDSQIHNYRPFQVVHCHDTEGVRDGLRIVLGDAQVQNQGDSPPPKQFTIEFTSNVRGRITPVPKVPPEIPAIPSPIVSARISATVETGSLSVWKLNSTPPILASVTRGSESNWELLPPLPEPVDFDWIVVSDGEVVTSDGQVVATQGDFSEIVVNPDGTVAVGVDGNVVTTGSSQNWASIVTSGGSVVTSGGFVVTS